MAVRRFLKVVATMAACLPVLGWIDAVQAQQHIGSGVYVCDGAAQAGPCQPESDNESGQADKRPGGNRGYTDNDYLKGMSFAGYLQQWGALAAGRPDSPAYIFGVSNSYSTGGDETREAAEANALRKCEYTAKKRTSCEIVKVFVNSCGSIVIGKKKGDAPGPRFMQVIPIQGRPGDGESVKAARSLSRKGALDPCEQKHGVGQCEVMASVCTPAIKTYE